jgi:hypothetical protein
MNIASQSSRVRPRRQSNNVEIFEPLSSQKTFEIGTDFVRDVFCYFKFDFFIIGIHPNDSSQWLGRCGQDGDFNRLVRVAHRMILTGKKRNERSLT